MIFSRRYILVCTLFIFLSGLQMFSFRAFSVSFEEEDSISYYFRYHKSTCPEKLYLTLDRPYYEAGDTIWFRGTLVNADNNSYMVKTNYIYVELLNRKDQVVFRRKVMRDNLCFHHNLPLAKDILSGEYTLRGYTSWMRNFDEAFFFSRKLTIVNKSSAPLEDSIGARDFHVSFFPEGGTLLSGVDQRVAFKAVGNDGLPVEIDGLVKDGRGGVLAELHSEHDGMGDFLLPASATVSAKTSSGNDNFPDTLFAEAVIRDYLDAYGMPFGRTFALPKVQTEGYALQVESGEDGKVHYRILRAEGESCDMERCGVLSDSLVLLFHSGSDLIARKGISAVQDLVGSIEMTSCRNGINHMVLCTADGRGLSRRLLFRLDSAWMVEGKIKLEAGNLSMKRDLVSLEFTLQDGTGLPMRGDFSVSVLDGGYVNCGYDSLRDNLVSNLLLTSDLQGYIHHPGWYFSRAVPWNERQRGLDLLMRTHGWCRFSTEDFTRHPGLEFPEPLEEAEWLSGKISRLNKKDQGKAIPISVVDTFGVSYGTGILDSLGHFFVGNLHYPDDARLQVRLLSYGKRPKFEFDCPEFPAGGHKEPFRKNFRAYLLDRQSDELMIGLDGYRTKLLENVEVVAQRRRPLEDRGKVIHRFSRDYSHIKANYDLYVNDRGIDIVNEMINNEWYKYMDEIDIFGSTRASSYDNRVPNIIIIDGYSRRKRGGGWLSHVHAEDIDSVQATVEVRLKLKGSNIERFVRVYLHPGVEITELVADKRRTVHRTFGYTLPEYFYHTVYRTEEERRWPEPDLRRTLTWFPSLQTDETGRADFRFYNSDHVGPRHVVIEGVTFSGRPVRVERVLE